jgi:hypothetical protein
VGWSDGGHGDNQLPLNVIPVGKTGGWVLARCHTAGGGEGPRPDRQATDVRQRPGRGPRGQCAMCPDRGGKAADGWALPW